METTTGIKPVSSGLQPDDLSFAHAVMEKGRGIEPPLSGLRDQRTASMCYPSMAERGGIEPQAVTLNLFSKQLQTQSTSLSMALVEGFEPSLHGLEDRCAIRYTIPA